MKKPNGYDLSFLGWFQKNGWRIYRFLGDITIWTIDGAPVHHKVTSGMIGRLEEAKMIKRIFPPDACVHDEFWVLNNG